MSWRLIILVLLRTCSQGLRAAGPAVDSEDSPVRAVMPANGAVHCAALGPCGSGERASITTSCVEGMLIVEDPYCMTCQIAASDDHHERHRQRHQLQPLVLWHLVGQ